MKNKKGQLSIGNAPMVVMIVGLTFLVMATIALIGQKYGEAIPSSKINTTTNEVVTQAELKINDPLVGAGECNAESFAISSVLNGSTNGDNIAAGNYSLTAATGQLKNLTSTFSYASWYVNYTFNYAGTACDVNKELETNIAENTSIAGIILTISLVGIILTLLIGVFLRIRTPRI